MNKMAKWETVDILLTETDGQLYVSQGGGKYKAREWKLTGELFDIIDLAISKGLSSVWRQRHPMAKYFEGGKSFEKSSHHIGFSRSPKERWVFEVGAVNW